MAANFRLLINHLYLHLYNYVHIISKLAIRDCGATLRLGGGGGGGGGGAWLNIGGAAQYNFFTNSL